MVSSWISSNTKKDASGVEAIKSLLRSLNINRAKLSGISTFRNELPGADKGLSKIISRVSNVIDIDLKSIKENTIELRNDSKQSCDLNSSTESAIRANLNVESLEAIKKWGSIKSFPKVGDINDALSLSAVSKNSQKQNVSTFCPNTATNLNYELQPHNYINSGDISRTLPAKLSQCVDSISTQTTTSNKEKKHNLNRIKVDITKSSKHSFQEKVLDELSVNSDKTANERKLKETNNENPYHRINLSINNYFNSPLNSPKRSKLQNGIEIQRKSSSPKRNVSKIISKRSSLGKVIREKQQIEKNSTVDCRDNNENKINNSPVIKSPLCKLLPKVDPKTTSNIELADNHILNNDNKTHYKITNLNSSVHSAPITRIHYPINGNPKQNVKMERKKSRWEAVLSGEHKTVAKPSQVLIPQSVTARHIFQPFAEIQEQSEINLLDNNIKKKNTHYVCIQNNTSTVIPENSSGLNSLCKRIGCMKCLLSTRDSLYQGDTNSEQIKSKDKLDIASNITILESKTFESGQLIQKEKLNNPHSQSLKKLKELLASTSEDKESIELPDESMKTDGFRCSNKKFKNNIASRTAYKSEMIQALKPVSEAMTEQLDSPAEIEPTVSLLQNNSMISENSFNELQSVSACNFDQVTFANTNLLRSFSTFVSFNEKLSNATDRNKSYRVMSTQTSQTSFNSLCKEKKDISVETFQLRLHSKYVNTERCSLIDSATGKDVLELQNFCCDTQFTNTESSMFDNNSIPDLKLQINSVESQITALKSLVNIGITDTSTEICNGFISTLPNELMIKKSLINNMGCEKITGIPQHVMKAFEVAAECARNVHRAIEIYHEHEMQKENVLIALKTEDCQKTQEFSTNLLQKQEHKTQSLTLMLDQITHSEKVLQDGLTKLLLNQEVQFALETILDQVEKQVQESTLESVIYPLKNTEEHCNKTDSEWLYSLEKSQFQSSVSLSKTKLLSIVYGAVCTLIFWSLQFSTSCELE